MRMRIMISREIDPLAPSDLIFVFSLLSVVLVVDSFSLVG